MNASDAHSRRPRASRPTKAGGDEPPIERRERGEAPPAGAPQSAQQPAPLDPVLAPALEIVRRLRDMVVRLGDDETLAALDEVDVALEVRLPVGRLSARLMREAARELSRQIAEQVTSQVDLAAALVPDHALCLRCGKPRCEHSRPPSPLAVVELFEPSGRPRWTELTSVLATLRDPRVDLLLADSPGMVARVLEGSRLSRGLLPVFSGSSRGVHLLGEVVAGFFTRRGSKGEPQRSALTFQAIALAAKGRRLRIVLSPVGLLSCGGSFGDLLAEGRPEGLPGVMAAARVKLDGLARRHGGARRSEMADLEAPVLAVLRDLARDIERVFNDRRRRTRHARKRARAGDRPTAKAFTEARTASDEQIRVDESEGTLVILGRGTRVHVFTPAGRHVTSVNYPRETIRIRKEARRWRASTLVEREQFRGALRNLDNGDPPGDALGAPDSTTPPAGRGPAPRRTRRGDVQGPAERS